MFFFCVRFRGDRLAGELNFIRARRSPIIIPFHSGAAARVRREMRVVRIFLASLGAVSRNIYRKVPIALTRPRSLPSRRVLLTSNRCNCLCRAEDLLSVSLGGRKKLYELRNAIIVREAREAPSGKRGGRLWDEFSYLLLRPCLFASCSPARCFSATRERPNDSARRRLETIFHLAR